MLKRLLPFAVPTPLFAICVFLCHSVAGMYFGVGMQVGDAVIVKDHTGSRSPARVIGFSERGAKVRCEEPNPSLHGMTLK